MGADASGNLYFADGDGITLSPGRSNSVFKIDPSGSITRVAGNSRTDFSGDGGPATSASLYLPRAVAVDRAGNVFIVDAGHQRVRRVALDGTITTVAGGGSAVLGDGGPATSGQLNYPVSIAVDSIGDLFIGEYGRVRKVTPDGIITTVAGGGPNDPGDGAPATSAQMSTAVSVAVDDAGDLFLADVNYDGDFEDFRFRKVTPDGIINTLPPPPNCCYGQITADAAGDLIVPAGGAVWKISPSGAKMEIAGNGTYGKPSGDGGPATQAQLNGVAAVALDPAGDLFIADNNGRIVRKVTPDGIIRSVASIPSSTPLPSGDGGPATNAQLQLTVPGLSIQSGLATDSAGNLYFAETGAHRVRKVSLDGTITTVAGVGAPTCTSTCLPLGDNGPATKAPLSLPTSVAVDSAGNLFIADSGDGRVRKVSPDGIITTVAGNGYGIASTNGDGGPATDAYVVPLGVAVDSSGNLFIAERSYSVVRKVAPDGTISTVLSANSAPPYFGPIQALTVDRMDNLYVAGNYCGADGFCYNAVGKVSASGDVTLITKGRDGSSPIEPVGNVGDGGPAINAEIEFASNLALDTAGNLFIADLLLQRLRKIDLNGIITTVAGNGATAYSGDGGPAANAALNFPFGLATDARGNVYFSDANQAVRVLRPSPQSK
jgi:sugar lactone lactonase YvrE